MFQRDLKSPQLSSLAKMRQVHTVKLLSLVHVFHGYVERGLHETGEIISAKLLSDNPEYISTDPSGPPESYVEFSVIVCQRNENTNH